MAPTAAASHTAPNASHIAFWGGRGLVVWVEGVEVGVAGLHLLGWWGWGEDYSAARLTMVMK